MSNVKAGQMAKVTPDKLGAEIEKILAKYNDEINENIDAIRKKVAQKGAQVLRNESKAKFGGSGDYAKGWTVTEVKHPNYTSAVIHNKHAGLPHLLEHGHALVRGGRTVGRVQGREHIAPVEEKLVEEFEKEVVSKL